MPVRTDAVRRWAQRLRRNARLRLLTAGAVVLLAVISALMVSYSNAATSTDAVPLSAGTVTRLSAAAASCPALTAARLAGQVMAATGFKATAPGGVSGLSASQWETWKPSASASPSDEAASLLALAHLTCDLVGQIRAADMLGDPWRMAVAATQSSVAALSAAGGIPTAVAAFVERVETYAAWYAVQPGMPVPLEAMPATVASPTDPPRSSSTPPPSPSASPSPAAPASSAPAVAATTTTRPAPTRLQYSSFGDSSGLRLNGSAGVSGGRLALTTGLAQAGSAWATTTIDPSRSFTTSFTALISMPTDGLAFLVQAQGPTALGGLGGSMGYGARSAAGDGAVRPSLAIELDTWDNSPDGFDPPGHQHIAVTANADNTRHLIWGDPGFDMCAGRPVYVWITYDATAHTLTLYAATTPSRPAAPLFAYPVNLRTQIGADRAYIGFTGGTGRTNLTDSRESILAWSFASA